KATAAATQLATEPAGSDAWLYDLLADLAQKPRGSVNAQTRLVGDLGFDSLLVAELTVALEKAGVKPPPESESAAITTAGELARRIESRGARVADGAMPALAQKRDDDIFVPGPVAAAGRAAIGFFQKALYGGVFEIKVTGRANVPANGAFLVAANHASHLDVGLVKVALGDEGSNLASLAARDYFFDNPWKRAWFGTFTNLV